MRIFHVYLQYEKRQYVASIYIKLVIYTQIFNDAAYD
jgi:hypothetical protein